MSISIKVKVYIEYSHIVEIKVLIYKRCKISEIHYYSVEKVAILALSQEERRSSYLVTIEISVFIQNCDLINSYQRSGDRPDLW